MTHEIISNDTDYPVSVWWVLEGERGESIDLLPHEQTYQQWYWGDTFEHQVCVKTRKDPMKDKCIEVVWPPTIMMGKGYNVSEIFGPEFMKELVPKKRLAVAPESAGKVAKTKGKGKAKTKTKETKPASAEVKGEGKAQAPSAAMEAKPAAAMTEEEEEAAFAANLSDADKEKVLLSMLDIVDKYDMLNPNASDLQGPQQEEGKLPFSNITRAKNLTETALSSSSTRVEDLNDLEFFKQNIVKKGLGENMIVKRGLEALSSSSTRVEDFNELEFFKQKIVKKGPEEDMIVKKGLEENVIVNMYSTVPYDDRHKYTFSPSLAFVVFFMLVLIGLRLFRSLRQKPVIKKPLLEHRRA